MKDLYGYICNTNAEDFKLTIRIVEEATKQSISDELDIARKCVQEGIAYEEAEELGFNYAAKNGRIKNYILYYKQMLQAGKLIGYNEEIKNNEVEKIYNNIVSGKQNENYVGMDERIALSVAAKYISTLNDHEFLQLLKDTQMITDEQEKSLTRKYKDIPNLKEEAYVAKRWKEISKAQKEATHDVEDTTQEQK